MCAICGCSGSTADHDHEHDHDHGHDHGHDHHHHHDHGHGEGVEARTIKIERDILDKNNRLAAKNRESFTDRRAVALNLMSAPGAGKTTLLERTIRDLGRELPLAVIEGDQATSRDADRIRRAGGSVVQINTGAGCHLDAGMVGRCLPELDPRPGSVVVIENVGNLVCPALFDLGERARVAMVSVAEGEDKPIKYPHMFRASDVMIVSKIDLLPHVPFDLKLCLDLAREVNPRLRILQLSATSGEGLAAWYAFLRELGSPPG